MRRASLGLALFAVGCKSQARIQAKDNAAPSVRACVAPDVPARLPAAERLIAIGDVHGDLAATTRALRLAQVVDTAGRWNGGRSVVVQTGDVLDRGSDEREIIEWFERLEVEAAAAGGRFIWLLGNHELMNGAGDFRDVTDEGMRDFATDDNPHAGRRRAFAPGGEMAAIFARQRTSVIVGDIVFSHAGIRAEWADKAEQASLDNACWFGGGPAEPAALRDSESLVWTRFFGNDVPCDALAQALAQLGARVMVVGHTVQRSGVTSACDGRVYRIDVGMSAHYGGPTQVLEFDNGQARVLSL